MNTKAHFVDRFLGDSKREGTWSQVWQRLNRARSRWFLTGWRGLSVAGLLPIVAGLLYQAAATANEIRNFPAPGRLVDIGGRRLHSYPLGEGGPTVVLEAAGLGCALDYEVIQQALAKETRVCAYDRAGMGWSDPYAGRLSVEALMEDLRALLHQERIGPPYILVGGSAGGLIIELFARRHPDEVAGLVMIDALDEAVLDRLPHAGAYLMRRISIAGIGARLGLLRYLDPFGLRKFPGIAGNIRSALTYRPAPWAAARSFLQSLKTSAAQLHAAPPLREDLPLIVLTHGVVGDLLGPHADPKLLRVIETIWQEQQAALARRTSRGRQIFAEKSGHRIIAQQPELVIEAVREVLSMARGK
ncbi:MAG: alpha/beta hydrolase [Nitrospirae bacterium]|nr:alpha/beta hydrolase [Candidatus Manganitrophaceae bacterium]